MGLPLFTFNIGTFLIINYRDEVFHDFLVILLIILFSSYVVHIHTSPSLLLYICRLTFRVIFLVSLDI